MVLLIAESVCSWKPACIRTCHSGVMSCAVLKTRCTSSGTSSKWMCPSLAIFAISSSEYHPPSFAMRTKSGLTSGMSAPAWFRMNATAKSGSIPPEQPAKMEMVPVGATVVRLQLRSLRIGRTRVPSARLAAFLSGPQIDFSQAGNTPRVVASRSDSTRACSFTKPMTRRPSSTPASES